MIENVVSRGNIANHDKSLYMIEHVMANGKITDHDKSLYMIENVIAKGKIANHDKCSPCAKMFAKVVCYKGVKKRLAMIRQGIALGYPAPKVEPFISATMGW